MAEWGVGACCYPPTRRERIRTGKISNSTAAPRISAGQPSVTRLAEVTFFVAMDVSSRFWN